VVVTSVLLMLVGLAIFGSNIVLSDYGTTGPAVSEMIYAPVPWALLGAMVAGAAVGVVSLTRRRSPGRIALVTVEVALAGAVAFLFLGFTRLPEHHLTVSVGDPFPSYSLSDQDGVTRGVQEGAMRKRALYIFYRGDW